MGAGERPTFRTGSPTTLDGVIRELARLDAFFSQISVRSSTGDPNGVVGGNPGDLYVDRSGGVNLTLWVKESGIGTTSGWAAK